MRASTFGLALAAILVPALGGRASGQIISFLSGFPKTTSPQGKKDGRVWYAGTARLAPGHFATVTLFAMPREGGRIRNYPVSFESVTDPDSPPGIVTIAFGSAENPLSTDILPKGDYFIWLQLGIGNPENASQCSSTWFELLVTQGPGATEVKASLTITAGQNGPNQIVAAVRMVNWDRYDPAFNRNGWRIEGKVMLFAIPTGPAIGPGGIRPATIAVEDAKDIRMRDVPDGSYTLFAMVLIKKPSTGQLQKVGVTMPAVYTVAKPGDHRL